MMVEVTSKKELVDRVTIAIQHIKARRLREYRAWISRPRLWRWWNPYLPYAPGREHHLMHLRDNLLRERKPVFLDEEIDLAELLTTEKEMVDANRV